MGKLRGYPCADTPAHSADTALRFDSLSGNLKALASMQAKQAAALATLRKRIDGHLQVLPDALGQVIRTLRAEIEQEIALQLADLRRDLLAELSAARLDALTAPGQGAHTNSLRQPRRPT